MNITIDGRPLECDFDADNLEEMLQNIMTRHIDSSRIIWTVHVNGEPYSETRPHQAAEIPAGDITALDILTMGKKDIAKDFFRNGGQGIEILLGSVSQISDLFRNPDIHTANQHYMELLDTLTNLFQMLELSREALDLEFEDIPYKGAPVREKVDQLHDLLDRMLEAQQQHQWPLLADLLSDELHPLLEDWQRILPELEQAIHP